MDDTGESTAEWNELEKRDETDRVMDAMLTAGEALAVDNVDDTLGDEK